MTFKVIGVYTVAEEPNVHLVELELQEKPSLIGVGSFTQENPNIPRDNWQIAYDEYYLNAEGEKVIGNYNSLPGKDDIPTRLTFFMYYLDFSIPLQSQFGELVLPGASPMPDRLSKIITYVAAD